MEGRAIANISWSIGLALWIEICSARKRRISETLLLRMKNQELENLIEGLGMLGFEDGKVLDRVGREVTKTDRHEGFKQQELANVFYALVLCGIKNSSILAILRQKLKRPRLTTFKGRSMARIVIAIAKLDLHGRDVLTTLSEKIWKIDRLRKYSMGEIDDFVSSNC